MSCFVLVVILTDYFRDDQKDAEKQLRFGKILHRFAVAVGIHDGLRLVLQISKGFYHVRNLIPSRN